MKRTPDKIKDYVELQSFDELKDVAADPARALAAYRFTDATSDLLARWLDALADLPRGRGTARALAGARGVGKSHTLTVFGALASSPELRARVGDAHAATSARRLLNRRYTVVRVERGLRPTLLEEMVAAFEGAIGSDAAQWGDRPEALLSIAASRVHDSTLVVIVDTATTREARVARDDGPVLSRLAAAAQGTNAFVALALDDDIADASGVNSVLAGSYAIDYLDPEHLYRVADQYLLRKNPQARAALHEIYLSLRSTVPGFNWSEPRFLALYPVHPLVADVAAAVRLYAPTFAFLPFAASAAARAVARPALSLILLDEVFDRAEHELRKSPELRDAFEAYEELATKCVAQFPVMQRLRAKLILKSLFIHSLDGRGATASELCAGLLLSDENAGGGATAQIEEVLARFGQAAPGALGLSDEGGEARHRFQISASTRFDKALAEAVERARVPETTVNELLRAVARARFEDWPLAGDTSVEADFQIHWRGSERAGRLMWRRETPATSSPQAGAPLHEWQIVMLAPSDSPAREETGGEGSLPASLSWRPAALTPEESNVLRRLIALRSESSLVEAFGETAHAAASTLGAQAQRIWARVYLDEGALSDGAARRTFTDEARASRTLSAALALTLAPLFDLRYPQHPHFAETLGHAEVADLIDAFLGNLDSGDGRVRHLARTFAQPLGLAALRGDSYTFETGDEMLGGACVRELLALLDAVVPGESIPVETVRKVFGRAPYGLQPEAQHLLVAALVAQRHVELVTTTGDRISRRTLSRHVKWEDVAGVRRSAAVQHGPEELASWARLLTGDETLRAIAAPEARAAVRNALAAWLEDWRARRVVERFNALPDEAMTTRAWCAAAAVRKSFGAAADAAEAALADEVSLEEGLQRAADAFGDSPDAFARGSQLLEELSAYIEGYAARARARAYLACAEPTGRDDIESARRELLDIAEDAHALFDAERRERFELLWHAFRTRYADVYAEAHDRAMKHNGDGRVELDTLTGGDLWREFETLSQLPVVSRRAWDEAEELLHAASRARCDLDVRQLLEEQPTCVCSFRLPLAGRLAHPEHVLRELAARGLASQRRTLALYSKQLRHALEALAAREEEAETASRARALANALAVGLIPEHLSRVNVRLIDRALRSLGAPAAPVRVPPPPVETFGLLTREELAARLGQWLDELPEDDTALIEIIGEKETNAA